MTESEPKTDSPSEDEEVVEIASLANFLMSYPLNSTQKISEYFEIYDSRYSEYRKQAPEIRLHCPREGCEGFRRFTGEWQAPNSVGKADDPINDFLIYTCKDCREHKHTFCITSAPATSDGIGYARKIGEFPEMHIDIPSALPNLLGPDHPYFIKGLKAEKIGLGVGASAYYRRVVENQKGRIVTKIGKVAGRLGASDSDLERFDAAAKEYQFGKAIDMIKDIFPESLLIDGHNPLKMLHRALSIGIHNESDEKCMTIAHSIRVVLVELSKRIKSALADEAEIRQAMSDILNFNEEASSGSKSDSKDTKSNGS